MFQSTTHLPPPPCALPVDFTTEPLSAARVLGRLPLVSKKISVHLISPLPQASVTFAATPLVAPGRGGAVLILGGDAPLALLAQLACVSMPPFDPGRRLMPNCMGDRNEAASGDSILGCALFPADRQLLP